MHIEHYNIKAPSDIIEKEKEFLCEVFGLEVGFRPKFSRSGYWLYSGKDALVHLTESKSESSELGKCYLNHIAFQMQGLHRLINTLSKMGVDYETDELEEIGMTQIFFKAPSGIGLEANFIAESL